MADIKQGLRLLLPVLFEGVDLEDVEQIEFVFTQNRAQQSTILKEALFKADGSGTEGLFRDGNTVFVPWEPNETFSFRPDWDFYMDTRITMKDTPLQPPTNIVKIPMDLTLFEKEE